MQQCVGEANGGGGGQWQKQWRGEQGWWGGQWRQGSGGGWGQQGAEGVHGYKEGGGEGNFFCKFFLNDQIYHPAKFGEAKPMGTS